MQVVIEERRCPRCGNRRTARVGTWGSICFNCGLHLDAAPPGVPDEVGPEPATYPFAPAELLRLEQYRAAVRAGLYSDWERLGTQR
jgi:hypothetical protein